MPLAMYQENSIKHVIAIAAGKGGVGKSTVTVNLALALVKLGFQVGILDADVYGPSLRKMLKEERRPGQSNQQFVPAECSGIKVISMAYFRPDSEAAAVRAPIANKVIQQFIQQVNWGRLDFLLVDYPPGTGDVQLTLSQHLPIDGAIMVTTPQQVAVMDVAKAIGLFRQVSVPILGIVENMSYLEHKDERLYPFGSGGGEALAASAKAPFMGRIPIDSQISLFCDRGESLLESNLVYRDLFTKLAEFFIQELKNGELHSHLKAKLSRQNELILIEKDGTEHLIKAKDIQKHCPCAGCESRTTQEIVDDVGIHHIHTAGKYALRFQFSKGCSNGIYSYEQLRKIGGIKEATS